MDADTFRRLHVKPQAAIKQVLGRPVRGVVLTVGRDKRDAGVPEKVVQQQIIAALKLIGVECMVTSQRRAAGVTIGMPDLFACIGDGLFVGVEVKRNSKSPLSPEQVRLRDEGKIVVVWTAQMALDAVRQKIAQVAK